MNTKPYKPYGGRRRHTWLKVLLALVLVLVLAAALVFAWLEMYIADHSHTRIDGQPHYMIIFGCQMKKDGPSILLKDRLDTALDYLEDHPDMIVIVTGGKGDDEHVSEAQGMYDYLTAHGVDGDRIYKEDQSRNTWQNITYTNALVREQGLGAYDQYVGGYGEYLLVSNGFHLARIGMLWRRGWWGNYAVSYLAAPVSHAPSAVQMFFREPLALVKSFFLDR